MGNTVKTASKGMKIVLWVVLGFFGLFVVTLIIGLLTPKKELTPDEIKQLAAEKHIKDSIAAIVTTPTPAPAPVAAADEMEKKLTDGADIILMHNQADDYIKSHLNDPDSYENVDYTTPIIEEANRIRMFSLLVKYRAKNGFGAKVLETSKVVIASDGYRVLGAKKVE
jgi:hypothetical protein